MRTEIDSPTYASRYNDPQGPIDDYYDIPAAPYLKLAAVHDGRKDRLTLFALNRCLDEEMPLEVDAAGFSDIVVRQALQLCDADLEAVNTKAVPDRVSPKPLARVKVDGQRVVATLAPASWNVLELSVGS
jgi:alpha-N-arabinofuranosidase